MSFDTQYAKYPRRITISAEAESYISELADNLASGAAGLEQLPPSLLAFYTFAFEDGAAVSVGPELERLRWERDLWYFCYANKKTPAQFYSHQTNELWNQAVAS